MLGTILKTIVLLLLSSTLSPFVSTVYGGFVDHASILEPSDTEIHYGYIVAPGFIDLGNLTFTPNSPRYDDDITGGEATVVDIVIFHLPQKCANLNNGCDWSEWGLENTFLVIGLFCDGVVRTRR